MTSARRRFRDDETGSVAVELLFSVMILVAVLTAFVVFWSGFRARNEARNATYVVADLVSREHSVDGQFLDASNVVLDALSMARGGTVLRVSVVERTGGATSLLWSERGDGGAGHASIAPIADMVPPLADGEQVIVVESERPWTPPLAVGMPALTFRSFAVAKPRFTGNLIWTD